MSSLKTYETELDEVIDIVIKLNWTYAIFCAFYQKKQVDRDIREKHPEFFLIIHESLLCNVCTAVTLLFKGKQKETSIFSLIKRIESSNPTLSKKLVQKIGSHKSLIRKVTTIRHQVFAHRCESKSPNEVFDEVKLYLKMLGEVVILSQFVTHVLAQEVGRGKAKGFTKHLEEGARYIVKDADLVMQTFLKMVH